MKGEERKYYSNTREKQWETTLLQTQKCSDDCCQFPSLHNGDITAKGKSDFSFFQKGKWLVIPEKQMKGNGMFSSPTKPQINKKHLTIQGPELGSRRRCSLKQLLELQNVTICEPRRCGIRFFSARNTQGIFHHWLWPCTSLGTFTSMATNDLGF